MSHFTKVATKITSLTSLMKALDRLKLTYQHAEQGVVVRGYRGQTLNAEISINMGKYDIGVVKAEDGTYTFVSDWWGVETTSGTTEEEFVEELNQQYAYVTVTEACKEEGYELQEVVDEKTQEIKLVATKWEG